MNEIGDIGFNLTIESMQAFKDELEKVILMQEEYTAARKERNAINKMERQLNFLLHFYFQCSSSQEERNQIKLDYLNTFGYLPNGFDIEEE